MLPVRYTRRTARPPYMAPPKYSSEEYMNFISEENKRFIEQVVFCLKVTCRVCRLIAVCAATDSWKIGADWTGARPSVDSNVRIAFFCCWIMRHDMQEQTHWLVGAQNRPTTALLQRWHAHKDDDASGTRQPCYQLPEPRGMVCVTNVKAVLITRLFLQVQQFNCGQEKSV